MQVAQRIFDCIVNDARLLDALGAAEAFKDIAGEPPSDLVTLISQGPGHHIHEHAYRYEKRIKKELLVINRVRDAQVRHQASDCQAALSRYTHVSTRLANARMPRLSVPCPRLFRNRVGGRDGGCCKLLR